MEHLGFLQQNTAGTASAPMVLLRNVPLVGSLMSQRIGQYRHGFGNLILGIRIRKAIVTTGAEIVFYIAPLRTGGRCLRHAGQIMHMVFGCCNHIAALGTGLGLILRGSRAGLMGLYFVIALAIGTLIGMTAGIHRVYLGTPSVIRNIAMGAANRAGMVVVHIHPGEPF